MAKNALLNYTTTVDVERTVGQIMGILVSHGAQSIMSQYNNGKVTAIAFQVKTPQGPLQIRLPTRPEAVRQVLYRQYTKGKVTRRFTDPEHAERVAWRIVKDWIEVQMAMLETEQVRMEEIFLAYVMNNEGRTLFEVLQERNLLPVGKSDHE